MSESKYTPGEVVLGGTPRDSESEAKSTSQAQDEERRQQAIRDEVVQGINDSQATRTQGWTESSRFLNAFREVQTLIRPVIDFKDPSTFAFFGSAEQYYKNSFSRISETYPYDGSNAERLEWILSASALDISILKHVYPKTTGHMVFSSLGTGSITATAHPYVLTGDPEYIYFSGETQPNTRFLPSLRMGNNLEIDGEYGNTVEFWLKKDQFPSNKNEVIFDIYTPSVAAGQSGYGRFLVEITGSSTNPFVLTYLSGTSGFVNENLTSSLTAAKIADGKWHHYAIAVANTGSILRARLYIDGMLDNDSDNIPYQTIRSATNLGTVTTNTSGTIGALASANSGNGGLGYGKLSGSLDDIRFWKVERNPREIGTYYDKPVYGATIDDVSRDPYLGLYYKMNEGILSNAMIDKNVLDYSGRINNGVFHNYKSTTRAEGSAITLSDSPNVESGDPIIYNFNSAVEAARAEYVNIGAAYDKTNHTSLAKSVPQWAYDAEGFGSSNIESDMGILIQTMASEFDTIKTYIDNILRIKSTEVLEFTDVPGTDYAEQSDHYLFGCSNEFVANFSGKEDNSKLAELQLRARGWALNGYGPAASSDQTAQEFFLGIGDPNSSPLAFEQKTYEIKNKILKNVYRNLTHLYKTKGTEKSFRNLIRCFGVSEELIRLNVYANNEEREILNEPVYITTKKKSISFENKNEEVTIYQTSSLSDERSYITGSSKITPWSVESCFIFPKYINKQATVINSSLFGAASSSASPHVIFNVSAIKYKNNDKIAYFKLTSSADLFPEITSSYYSRVYDNSKWNFAVIASKDSSIPLKNIDSNKYQIEFVGKEYDLDVLRNSFHLSSSITKDQYEAWSRYNKAFYMGAERVNLTGAVSTKADTRAVFLNAWNDKLSTAEIKEHAFNPNNYGREKPHFISEHNDGGNFLNLNNLALSWHFDDLTETNTSSKIDVVDSSSGSLGDVEKYGEVAGYKHPAISTVFSDTINAIEQEYLATVEYVEVDNAYTSDRIKIKEYEIDKFTVDSRPITYLFSFEKSMYQVISKEMLNFVAGLVSLNNLLGEPVNKYRQEYKMLEKIRERFFSRKQNDIDLDRFVKYYKWLDASLGNMLGELQPATSNFNSDFRNVVESHALERNKYEHKFPTLEFKKPSLPVAPFLGINELLYDWEHGHASEDLIAATATFMSDTGSGLSGKTLVLKNTDGTTHTITGASLGGAVSNATQFNVDIIGNANNLATQIRASLAAAASAGNIKMTVSAVTNNSDGAPRVVALTQTTKGSPGNTEIAGTLVTANKLIVNNTTAGGSHGALIFVGGTGEGENAHCLWQTERAERDNTIGRETLKNIITKNVEGSTYALRRLTKPYKFSTDRQDFLVLGSNRKANKIKGLYKIVDSGKEITINSSDIYEFKQCNDVLNPQAEKIYTAKTNIEGTNGYLDADADLILPFTLYSSSVGIDFQNFKSHMAITNNHDDETSLSLQGPFTQAHVGGLPHRRVPFGTADADRPEAYDIVSSPTSLVIKATQKPKSMFSRDRVGASGVNIRNIKYNTGSLLVGNYTKDYEIVMTNGRSLNNNYFVDQEGAFLKGTPYSSSPHVSGVVDFAVPDRGRTEHVVVNRFSAPGGPETAGAYGLDRPAGEYSVYGTINYRNSIVRDALNLWSKEYSNVHGYRSGSTTQASVHATNRNPLRFTGSLGKEVNYDNFFVQHPIPQNDFGYAWITASAQDDVYAFLVKNANHGYQHMFDIPGVFTTAEVADFLIMPGDQANDDRFTINVPVLAGGTGVDITIRVVAPADPSDGTANEIQVGLGAELTTRNRIVLAINGLDSSVVKYGAGSGDVTNGIAGITATNGSADSKITITAIEPGTIGNNILFTDVEGTMVAGGATGASPAALTGGKFTSLDSSETITFLSASEGASYSIGPSYQGRIWRGFAPGDRAAPSSFSGDPGFIDFVGLRTHVLEPVSANTNTLGHDSLIFDDKTGSGVFYNVNYINTDITGGRSGAATGENIYDYMGLATILNAIILNRQGPYGWPSWKQIRGGSHPVMRQHRKDNTFSILIRGAEHNVSSKMEYEFDWLKDEIDYLNSQTETQARTIKNYKDVPATSRFNPLVMTKHRLQHDPGDTGFAELNSLVATWGLATPASSALTQENEEKLWYQDEYYYNLITTSSHGFSNIAAERDPFVEAREAFRGVISLRLTYQNDLTTYANPEIIRDLKVDEIKPHKFSSIYPTWFPGPEEAGSTRRVKELRELNYIETIYPREENTYTKNARTRENFVFYGWNSLRSNREAILTGNVSYTDPGVYAGSSGPWPDLKAFPYVTLTDEDGFVKSSLGIDRVNMAKTGSMVLGPAITASAWVMDSRESFTSLPLNLSTGFFQSGQAFLEGNTQGTRGEGLFQNDYGIFAMGYNGLYGTPPIAITYNRRIPQKYGSNEYLAGEAKFEAADNKRGPFYNSYEDYNDEIRRIGQDHSILPEFRISEFLEKYYDYDTFGEISVMKDEFLNLTGAIYHSSSGDLQIGTQFFKTYGTSDFMKYFGVLSEKVGVDNGLGRNSGAMSPTRLTLRCQAAMKFLPYRGFYPAERVAQLGEIFTRRYLRQGFYEADLKPSNFSFTDDQRTGLLNKRIAASKQQSMKVLFSPGLINNSIKAGLAVDYPIFRSLSYTESDVTGCDGRIDLKLNTEFMTSSNCLPSLDPSDPFPVAITGSFINDSIDLGIPRLSGSLVTRIDFDDLLNIENLYETEIYDNEPHPSASLYYGNKLWNTVIERPFKFGNLNKTDVNKDLQIDFSTDLDYFSFAMLPFKSAIQNFTAETVSFFLENESLETISTPPVKAWMDNNKVYTMRIYVDNTDTVMYDRHSAFGPPVDANDCKTLVYGASPAVPAMTDAVLKTSYTQPTANKKPSSDSVAEGIVPPTLAEIKQNPYISITDNPDATEGRAYLYNPDNYYKTVIGDTGGETGSLNFSFLSGKATYTSFNSHVTFMLYDATGDSRLVSKVIAPHPVAGPTSALIGNEEYNPTLFKNATTKITDLDGDSLTIEEVALERYIRHSKFADPTSRLGISATVKLITDSVSSISGKTINFTDAEGGYHSIGVASNGGNGSTQAWMDLDLIGSAASFATQLSASLGLAIKAGLINIAMDDVIGTTSAGGGSANERVITLTQISPGDVGNTTVGGTLVSGNKIYVNTPDNDPGGPHGEKKFLGGFGPWTYLSQWTGTGGTNRVINTNGAYGGTWNPALTDTAIMSGAYHPMVKTGANSTSDSGAAVAYSDLNHELSFVGHSNTIIANELQYFSGTIAPRANGGFVGDTDGIPSPGSGGGTQLWTQASGRTATFNYYALLSEAATTVYGIALGIGRIVDIHENASFSPASGEMWSITLMEPLSAGSADNAIAFTGTRKSSGSLGTTTTTAISGPPPVSLVSRTGDIANGHYDNTTYWSGFQLQQNFESPILVKFDFCHAGGTAAAAYSSSWGSIGNQGNQTDAIWAPRTSFSYNLSSAGTTEDDGYTKYSKDNRNDHFFAQWRYAPKSVQPAGTELPGRSNVWRTCMEIAPCHRFRSKWSSGGFQIGAATETVPAANNITQLGQALSEVKGHHWHRGGDDDPNDALHYSVLTASNGLYINVRFLAAGPNAAGSSVWMMRNLEVLKIASSRWKTMNHASDNYTSDYANVKTLLTAANYVADTDWNQGATYDVDTHTISQFSEYRARQFDMPINSSSIGVTMVYPHPIASEMFTDSTNDDVGHRFSLAQIKLNTAKLQQIETGSAGNTNLELTEPDMFEPTVVGGVSAGNIVGLMMNPVNMPSEINETLISAGPPAIYEPTLQPTRLDGETTHTASLAFQSGEDGTIYKQYYNTEIAAHATDYYKYVPTRTTVNTSLVGTQTVLSSTTLRNNITTQLQAITATRVDKITVTNVGNYSIHLVQEVAGYGGNNVTGPGFASVNAGTSPSFAASSIFNDSYAVAFTGGVNAGATTSTTTATVTDMHGFMPYVPPYLDPGASPYVELTFHCSASKFHNAREIVNNLTASYVNFPEGVLPPGGLNVEKSNYKHAMAISASIDFTKIVELGRDKYVTANPFRDAKEDEVVAERSSFSDFGQRWVIQPKWETPIHDFSDTSLSALNLSNNQVSSVTNSPWKNRYWEDYFTLSSSGEPYLTASTGIWHQYSPPPTSSKGYYLRVEDVGKNGLATAVGFLRGIDYTVASGLAQHRNIYRRLYSTGLSTKLGKLADKKTIKESVVAIPYYLSKDCKVNFFDLNPTEHREAVGLNSNILDEYIDRAKRLDIDNKQEIFDLIKEYERRASIAGPRAVDNIAYQLRMMKRYILPPFFDFEAIESISPFVAYFFEFNAVLDSTDLSNIWQNLYPESPGSTGSPRYSNAGTRIGDSHDVIYSSHILDSTILNELNLDGNRSNYQNPEKFLEEEVRWMVFKCKFRAENNYKSLIKKSIDPIHYFERMRSRDESLVKIIGDSGHIEPPVSYNWPYDYFSFVELVKLESKVDFYGLGFREE